MLILYFENKLLFVFKFTWNATYTEILQNSVINILNNRLSKNNRMYPKDLFGSVS